MKKWTRKEVSVLLDASKDQMDYAIRKKRVVQLPRYAHNMYTAEQVRDLANHFGVVLPAEVKKFLKRKAAI